MHLLVGYVVISLLVYTWTRNVDAPHIFQNYIVKCHRYGEVFCKELFYCLQCQKVFHHRKVRELCAFFPPLVNMTNDMIFYQEIEKRKLRE